MRDADMKRNKTKYLNSLVEKIWHENAQKHPCVCLGYQ